MAISFVNCLLASYNITAVWYCSKVNLKLSVAGFGVSVVNEASLEIVSKYSEIHLKYARK